MSLFKKRKKLFIILGVIVVVVAIALVILFKFVLNKRSKMPTFQSTSTVTLEKTDLVKSISATGTIESQTSKEITATGNNLSIDKVKVSVGDKVKKGQTLVTFNKDDLQDAYDEAKENLSDVKSQNQKSISKAQKQLDNAKKDYSDANKEKKQEVSDAKKKYESAKSKVNSLKKKVKANPSDESLKKQLEEAEQAMEQAKSAYEQAQKDLKNTNKQNQSSIDNAKDSLETANDNYKKNVKDAQKQVDNAKENLSTCSVKSMVAGTVTTINVEEGDSYSGSTIMTIDDLDAFCVTTSVDEYDINSVKEGQRVVIKTDATGDEELEGEIDFVALTTTSASSSSSNSMMGGSSSSSSSGYEVRIILNDTNESLRLGMTAKCSIILEEASDVYAVPYDAIHEDSDGNFYINVIDESSSSSDSSLSDSSSSNSKMPNMSSGFSSNYKKITVTKGLESDYYVEISGSELTDGLKVVVDTDAVSSSSSSDSSSGNFGDFSGGMPGGGFSGGMPSGDFSGGMPGR